MATAIADPNAAVLAASRAAANNQNPTSGSNAASTPASGPASTQSALAAVNRIPGSAFPPATQVGTIDSVADNGFARNALAAASALPGAAPLLGGVLAAGGRLVQGAAALARTAPVAAALPYLPVAAGGAALVSAANPGATPTPTSAAAAAPAPVAAPIPAPAPVQAPPQFSTAGNVIVNGRDASGKANSFSGTNVGANAAYVNPDGTGTTIGGTGASAGAGAPVGMQSAGQAGIGPVETRNPVGPTAGLIVPGGVSAPVATPASAAVPTSTAATAAPAVSAVPTGTAAPAPAAIPTAGGVVPSPAGMQPYTGYRGPSGIDFGLSPAQQFDAGATGLPVRAALQGPDTAPAIQRANNIQDMQIRLAQQALALASTGNLSDAIQAKHIRSTIAALSGASNAGSAAVNPLLNQQQSSATAERDTNVADSTARMGHTLTASASKYAIDADLFSKQPQHVQQAVMAQLAQQASQPGPAGQEALERLHQYMLVMKSPAQQLVSDVTGANTYVYDPVTGNYRAIPAAQPAGRGAPVPADGPGQVELNRRTAAKNAAAQAESAQ